MSEPQLFYQAIGELLATLVTADDGSTFLETQEARYQAFMPSKLKQQYLEQHQHQQVYWRIYPQFQEEKLVLQVVSLVNQPKRGHGQFVLKGDWLESGQLQIWRNAVPGRVNKYNWRPRLIPVSWENAPPPDDAFWQLQAQLVDGVLKVTAAEGPFLHPPRLEKLPDLKRQQQRSQSAVSQPQVKTEPVTTTVSFDWEELTAVNGKLELTIKFNTLPQVKQVNGQCHFKVDCDGRVFQVTMRQKQWSKLETANSAYTQWVAALSGKLGAATSDGFVLEEPNIQVFKRSTKQDQAKEPEAGTQVQPSVTEPPLEETREKVASEAKSQGLKVTIAGSRPTPLEKPDAQVQTPNAKAESKPKKIGKFNVDIR